MQLQHTANLDRWTQHLLALVLSDMQRPHRLGRLNEDRNRLAHGQQARAPSEIEADLRGFVAHEGWNKVRQEAGDPSVSGLEPWVRRFDLGHDEIHSAGAETQGLLNRWTPKQLEYLLPVTGRTVRIAQSPM